MGPRLTGLRQQWTGTNSINYYAPQIFKQIGLAGSSSSLLAVGVYGIVKIVRIRPAIQFK